MLEVQTATQPTNVMHNGTKDETHQRTLGYLQDQHQQEFIHTDQIQQSLRNHQSALGAIQIQTQQALAESSLYAEQRRIDMAATAHQLERDHQAKQNRWEIEHAQALVSERLRAQSRQQAMELRYHVSIACIQHAVGRSEGGYAETINEERRLE